MHFFHWNILFLSETEQVLSPDFMSYVYLPLKPELE